MARCATTVFGLLRSRHLHLRSARVGTTVRVPDGRAFTVFRESWCDEHLADEPVILLVWFRLRGVPAGARIRRWAFERESILNTVLYAGMPGFRVKLWMVDERSSDYGGLYEWDGEEPARAYGRYITAVLRPLCVPGSVGFELLRHGTLADFLRPSPDGDEVVVADDRRRSTRSIDRSRGSRWDRHVRHRLADDVRRLGLRDGQPHPVRVTDSELLRLPEPAQRYLRFMGVPDRPREQAFATRFVGEIRMRPEQAWMPFHAWQFNAADPVTRLIRMRIDVARIIPMFGTDTYVHGSGRMLGKLLGLITVADGEGPEFDLGELVTYVNDAAMLAPSLLLTPSCEWTAVDDDSFDVTFTDGANVVRARLVVDEVGRLVDFRTDDRWFAGTDPPSQAPWSTPVAGWTTTTGGRPVPAFGSAVWHLPDGDFTYVRGRFDATTMHVDADAIGVLTGRAVHGST
jgi:hypothetical protein